MSAADTGTFATVLVAEVRSEYLKAVRIPVFTIAIIVFPAMFYVLFGLVVGGRMPVPGVTMPAYLLASYGTFGVVGAGLFGVGVGVAAERGQGWLMLKRTTPMPPLAWLLAKAVMSMMVGAAIVALLGVLGTVFGDVRLDPLAWLALIATLVLGAAPFCALGCAIGYLAGPNSAPVIANLIYLPMSLLSGLWIPIEFLPPALREAAVLMPPYHLARLALAPVTGSARGVGLRIVALAAFMLLFIAIALAAYRRDEGRTWG